MLGVLAGVVWGQGRCLAKLDLEFLAVLVAVDEACEADRGGWSQGEGSPTCLGAAKGARETQQPYSGVSFSPMDSELDGPATGKRFALKCELARTDLRIRAADVKAMLVLDEYRDLQTGKPRSSLKDVQGQGGFYWGEFLLGV